jgi:hypothetical protein
VILNGLDIGCSEADRIGKVKMLEILTYDVGELPARSEALVTTKEDCSAPRWRPIIHGCGSWDISLLNVSNRTKGKKNTVL